jgi:hypothetical protein
MGEEKKQTEKKPEPAPPAPVKAPAPHQHDGTTRQAGSKSPEQSGPAKQAQNATQLQQSVGNQQTNRILRAARDQAGHPALPVSHPDDKAEKEAEAVAHQVTQEAAAHPPDHPGPAHGDPAAVTGDPHRIAGDPSVVHRAAAPGPAHPQPPPVAPGHAPDPPSPAAILDHPGPGGPIPQPTLGILERKLNADLRHVVVHHDTQSDVAARALAARAVTRGNHIWLASDASPNDLHLMAHEVTHVLQHHEHVVHRAPDGGAAPAAANPPGLYTAKTPTGTIDTTPGKRRLELNSLPVPDWKLSEILRLGQPAGHLTVPVLGIRDTSEKTIWDASIAKDAGSDASNDDRTKAGTSGIGKKLNPLLDGTVTLPKAPPHRYVLKMAGGGSIVGTGPELYAKAYRPQWGRKGQANPMDVDHALEIQLSGLDDVPNYWLLDAAANQSAGGEISRTLGSRINLLLAEATGVTGKPANYKAVLDKAAADKFVVTIGTLTGGLKVTGNPEQYWQHADVLSGLHVDQLRSVDEQQAKSLGFGDVDDPAMLHIHAEEYGGASISVPWDHHKGAPSAKADLSKLKLFSYFETTAISYRPETGTMTGTAVVPKDQLSPTPIGLTLRKHPKFGKDYTVQVFGKSKGSGSDLPATRAIESKTRKARFKGLSEVEITDLDLRQGTGFYLKGLITPSIPLLSGQTVGIEVNGTKIAVSKTWKAADLKGIGPIKPTSGQLTVKMGTGGLEGSGELKFDLGTLAKGAVSAEFDPEGTFSLRGAVDFDRKLFEQAHAVVDYKKKDQDTYDWGLTGDLTMGPAQVPGVRKASVALGYRDQVLSAAGTATLSVPGLDSGQLSVRYGAKEGLVIDGTFELSKAIPGIESGSVGATITRTPPGNEYRLAAHGSAKPKIPGISAELKASYEDGVFTVEGTAAYARGMLSGSVHIGASNRPPAPAGKPAGKGTPAGKLSFYGGGELTLKLAPWLQATAGVTFDPAGEIKLDGEVKLPDAIDLFPAKEIKKNIVTVGLDIPIVGVAVAGQRIGIFATIQGGLDAEAGVGPGQLQKLGLKVHYEPGKEENTSITGGAALHVPAHAGLRLFVRGAVGAGIPLVSAEAGLEIGGKLGLAGAFDSSVQINWTPKAGLVLDANVSLSAEPQFTFDITGFVKVEAGAFGFDVTLYEKQWNLASFAYGSGLRIGVHAPVHYEQGKPFDFSLENVKFDLPQIDPGQIVKDLVKRIA